MSSKSNAVGKSGIVSPKRLRRLSKSDSKLNRIGSVEEGQQHVRSPAPLSPRPVARMLEVLRVDSVLTNDQAQAAAVHLESMPVSVKSRSRDLPPDETGAQIRDPGRTSSYGCLLIFLASSVGVLLFNRWKLKAIGSGFFL